MLDRTQPGISHESTCHNVDEDPVFVKVITMIPETLFWIAVGPVAHYTDKACNELKKQWTSLYSETEDEPSEEKV